MKRCGFTLAEVLITLGIIGVVAAITTPALVMHGQNEANAAKLSVVVSNLENALQTAMAKEGVDSLTRTSLFTLGDANTHLEQDEELNWVDSDSKRNIPIFAGRLGQYMILNGFSDEYNTENYYTSGGPYELATSGRKGADTTIDGRNGLTRNEYFRINLKNGAVLWLKTYANGDRGDVDEAAIINAGGSLLKNVMDVYIDVNGQQGPNVFGRDIFSFYTGDNGVLYPFGSMDVSIYETNDANLQYWNNPDGVFPCIRGDNIEGGTSCTARLVEEGYKMNY